MPCFRQSAEEGLGVAELAQDSRLVQHILRREIAVAKPALHQLRTQHRHQQIHRRAAFSAARTETAPCGSACACLRPQRRSSAASESTRDGTGVFHQISEVIFRSPPEAWDYSNQGGVETTPKTVGDGGRSNARSATIHAKNALYNSQNVINVSTERNNQELKTNKEVITKRKPTIGILEENNN